MPNIAYNLYSPDLNDYKISVLLIDDQAIVGESIRRMLESEKDIVFHYCSDPTNALQIANEINPTVILQDLIMPDIDGLTLVKFFRAHPNLKDTPLIVLSSKEEPITKAEAFSLGANDYLVKLPDKIELIARIRYHSKGYINLLLKNDAYNALLKSQQALASELAKAGQYCVSLLPEPISQDKIKTDWRFIPSEQLGGDSFGYHWLDEDNFAMYLLDVCGHGVGSALLSVSALNTLRTQTLPDTDFRKPEQVLIAMNKSFQMTDHNNMYFTLWYGVYNKITSEISFASAGHPPAILINKDGEVQNLFTQNFIIGGLPDYPYKGSSVHIITPSELYIYSDGVYEIKQTDASMWKIEEMVHFLVENRNIEISPIDALYLHVQKIGGQKVLDDDFSMLRICIQ